MVTGIIVSSYQWFPKPRFFKVGLIEESFNLEIMWWRMIVPTADKREEILRKSKRGRKSS